MDASWGRLLWPLLLLLSVASAAHWDCVVDENDEAHVEESLLLAVAPSQELLQVADAQDAPMRTDSGLVHMEVGADGVTQPSATSVEAAATAVASALEVGATAERQGGENYEPAANSSLDRQAGANHATLPAVLENASTDGAASAASLLEVDVAELSGEDSGGERSNASEGVASVAAETLAAANGSTGLTQADGAAYAELRSSEASAVEELRSAAESVVVDARVGDWDSEHRLHQRRAMRLLVSIAALAAMSMVVYCLAGYCCGTEKSVPEPQEEAGLYEVEIQASGGQLAIDVDQETLMIRRILDGPLHRHNMMNPQKAVRVGDRFKVINGMRVATQEEYVQAMAKSSVLHATLYRGAAVPLAGTPLAASAAPRQSPPPPAAGPVALRPNVEAVHLDPRRIHHPTLPPPAQHPGAPAPGHQGQQ